MSTPFEQLDKAGQFDRLQQLASEAVSAYPLQSPAFEAIQNEENATFRVTDAAGSAYVVRIHRPGLRTLESVVSELTWLEHLTTTTGLVVPRPVRTRQGDLVRWVEAPGVPEPRLCVLFHWVDGEFLDETLDAAHLRRVGAFTATLQADAFDSPAGFRRPRTGYLTTEARTAAAAGTTLERARREIDNPADETATLSLIAEVCGHDDSALAAAVIATTRSVQREIGQSPDAFGLIHADLHQENYLFSEAGEVRAIDFDDCGFGLYLYDLAVTLSELQGRDGYADLRAGLLAGYRSVRALTAAHEGYLDTLIAYRLLQVIVWMVELREAPVFVDRWQRNVHGMFGQIRALLGE